MISKQKSDAELVLMWKAGNQEAVMELLKRYQPLILRLVKSSCEAEDFEDVRQDLILAFLIYAKEYDPSGTLRFTGYITRRLRWKRRDMWRKVQCRLSHEELTLDDQPEKAAEDEELGVEELLPKVAEAARLTQKQSRVFYLWMRGLSPQEIQAETGICPSSLSRMKEMIRQRLRAHREEIAEWVTA